MKAKFITTFISYNGKKLQILKPVIKFENTYVIETAPKVFIIFGNEEELKLLANLFNLVSCQKDVLIYLPVKKKSIPTYLKNWSNYVKQRDLVILHHSTQFKTKNWKQLREKIRKSHKVISLDLRLPTWDKNQLRKDFERINYKENKEFLDLKIYAETLFMMSSSRIYYLIAYDTEHVSINGKMLFEKYPGFHEHEHLNNYLRDPYLSNKGNGFALTVDFYDKDLWGE
ncbi:hypothetical protein WAK64_15280 [Bacillus spongiae]|uniref:Uncharacterized protein n=1 Tax=Bacillus spongiae TaxID=2683610 RepID=A0ABU8HGX0_9BACI